jgi:hypothetical protein
VKAPSNTKASCRMEWHPGACAARWPETALWEFCLSIDIELGFHTERSRKLENPSHRDNSNVHLTSDLLNGEPGSKPHHFLVVRRGRPIGFLVLVPCFLAAFMPALTRSQIESRSNCATATRMCISSLLAGLDSSVSKALRSGNETESRDSPVPEFLPRNLVCGPNV